MAPPPSPPLSPSQKLGTIAVALAALVLILIEPPSGLPPAAQRLAAVTLLMAGLWFTQALPIAATSLIPILAFPLLGIQPVRDVGQAYLSPSSFLFLGGFIIALGIERWELHRRLALKTVCLVGQSPRRIVLGFMIATTGISMWISNTAAALLMLPIGLALLETLEHSRRGGEFHGTGTERDHEFIDKPAGRSEPVPLKSQADDGRLAVAVVLGIAYCASIGGMLTLVGTPTNIAFLENFRGSFPKGPDITTGQWLLIFLPMGVAFVAAAWLLLTWHLPRGRKDEAAARFFAERLAALGPPRRGEVLMFAIVGVAILLWIFRSPFELGGGARIPGWGDFVEAWLVGWGITPKAAATYHHDALVAIGLALVMFCVPVERTPEGRVHYLMTWEEAERLPWGILLLIGGGFAIASAFDTTGLSRWIGDNAAHVIAGRPTWQLVLAVCCVMTFLTEFTTNVATANIVLPILAGAAVSLGVDPRLLMLPATISVSAGFMLPIGTPPNAIAFSTGRVTFGEMVRYGFVLNLIGIVLVTLATLWFAVPQLGITPRELPEWAVHAEGTKAPQPVSERWREEWGKAPLEDRAKFRAWLDEGRVNAPAGGGPTGKR